ncbi:MAG: RHS repeat-associated core domain-containing protein [Ardenticatenales bacterium]|nr:RHS repeat-associated core domain-containing protein [Ardenticatenales bacterium]
MAGAASAAAHPLPLPSVLPRTAPSQTYTDRSFTGQKHNDDLGLIYYNARYYVPGIARFASADTIVPEQSNPQTLNRYAYTRNNPLKYVDPTGHCAQYAGSEQYKQCTDAWSSIRQYYLMLQIEYGEEMPTQWIQDQYETADIETLELIMKGLGIDQDYQYSPRGNGQLDGKHACQYWQSCWERDHQTTHTESNLLGFSKEQDIGKGLVAENPPAVICFAVCIAWGNKDYVYADGRHTEEKQVGFGIGFGADFNEVDVGIYFVIRGTWLTDTNGNQHHRPGSAFSISLPLDLVEYKSATTVDLGNP